MPEALVRFVWTARCEGALTQFQKQPVPENQDESAFSPVASRNADYGQIEGKWKSQLAGITRLLEEFQRQGALIHSGSTRL